MSAYYVLTDLAEQLLKEGKDRLPFKVDRRTMKTLKSHGLLTYPDGTFSVSDGAMDSAVRTWSIRSKDPFFGEAGRKMYSDLVQRGRRWQQPPAVIAGLRYGELTYEQYTELWETVVRQKVVWRDVPSLTKKESALWRQLEKRGYVTSEVKGGQTLVVTVTPKGAQLVNELGSPNPNHRTASYDFRGEA